MPGSSLVIGHFERPTTAPVGSISRNLSDDRDVVLGWRCPAAGRRNGVFDFFQHRSLSRWESLP
jgi:hypothetical protein